MATVVDLVCGMDVDTEMAPASSVYRGQTYYFCAPGCKVAFDEDPEGYLQPTTEAAVAPSPDSQTARGLTVETAIKTRRSVARLRSDAVPRETIARMLEAAVWAPNHHLTEPWGFIVLTGNAKQRFAEIRRDFRRTLFKNPDAPEIQPALRKIYADTLSIPVIIAVTTTAPDDADLRDDDYGATMCAIQNMLLVATSLGLGTYLRTGALIHHGPLLEFLGVPEGRRIAGVIYVGYPDLIPNRRRAPSVNKTTWLD